jgi:hypothetical protein
MIFNSKYPVLKLKSSGQGVLSTTSGNGGATVEITHGLGYKPIVYVYGKWIGLGETVVRSTYALWNRFVYQGVQESDVYRYYTDTTKLYIVLELSTLTDVNNYSFNYMYHIFYDEDTL